MILLAGRAVWATSQTILGEAATKRDVPLDADDVMVTREGTRTLARVSYTENVEIFPRYLYPVSFSISARVRVAVASEAPLGRKDRLSLPDCTARAAGERCAYRVQLGARRDGFCTRRARVSCHAFPASASAE
jgi:hypothetical protein